MSSYIQLHKKHFNFKQFILNALKEDVGDGDHTALSTIPASHKGKMHLLVKEDGIIAGIDAAKEIFKLIDKNIKIKTFIKDGQLVKKGDIAFIVEGKTQKLITAERLVLNIMQRMSGIATKTNYLQSLCKGTKAKVIDTRKTTPGFRFFEKWAVVIGGGANHRYGLFDMILIKDNHISVMGGIKNAINRVRENSTLPIEVEARTLEEVKESVEMKAQRILLDNMDNDTLKKALAMIPADVETEASGNMNLERVRAVAEIGVNYISVGALTHSAPCADVSLIFHWED